MQKRKQTPSFTYTPSVFILISKRSMRVGVGCYLSLATATSGLYNSATVTTTLGPVQGTDHGTTLEWLGVPFAAPAVGEIRWRAPQPHNGWTTTLATTATKLCHQADGSGTEEACLNMNVWAPKRADAADAKLLPVMVWVHGGSFTSSAPSAEVYDGTRLTAASNTAGFGGNTNGLPVVTASIQYRVGGLGFMAHKKLTAEGDSHGSSGNYGMLDILEGLRWVQANIAKFGGDPGRVMVYGESAGAYAMCVLMGSPLSTGLFHRIAMESAYCANSYVHLAAAEQAGTSCSSSHNCSSAADELACLRALPASLAAGCTTQVLPSAVAFGPAALPNIDGYLLTDTPLKSIAAGRSTDGRALPAVPSLLGSNKGEFMAFAFGRPSPLFGLSDDGFRSSALPALVQGEASANAAAGAPAGSYPAAYPPMSQLSDAYFDNASFPADSLAIPAERFAKGLCDYKAAPNGLCPAADKVTPAFRRAVGVFTDGMFTSTAQGVSAALAGRCLPTYRYLFEGTAEGTNFADLGPFHGLDVPFVFNTFDKFCAPPTCFNNVPSSSVFPNARQAALSKAMQSYWVNFAYNGSPNAGGAANETVPQWDAVEGVCSGTARFAPGEPYLRLRMGTAADTASVMGSGFRAKQVGFWADVAKARDAGAAPTVAPTLPPPPPSGARADIGLGLGLGFGLGVPGLAAVVLLHMRQAAAKNRPGSMQAELNLSVSGL